MTSVEENAKRLVDAAKRGELPIIKELSELANCIEFIDLPVNGMTALHYASCGKPLLVSALLKMGASLEMRDNDGFTALLHASSMDGSVECLNLLLEAGANPNVECNMNKTGLFYCQGSQAKVWMLCSVYVLVRVFMVILVCI